ncbi:MAG: helicase-related protein, partial [Acutalibacteraceae bacterium]|nr:helicase-related protein [Acutalibacteraceae bacterium]
TMVAMFETAIDYLCQEKGVLPKIVASTATIRHAKEQCAALYNRDVAQFPSPGLDAGDSYFAREAAIDHEKGEYGRLYVGMMSSGKTKAMMEVRSIASLMQCIHKMPLSDKVKDKFWTLTTYFGSLRDLGKCRTLAEDDIKDAITRQAQRLGTKRNARKFYSPDELTSRATTTELNETLDKLEKTQYSLENYNKVSHLLLATNMISVGIDVARLNVILLIGQPKLTSEYIQASSRVGRSFPGVAFTMYDASKSRDRSHFEQFKQYHDSFYRYVEPTGATPFSKPARERSLKALLVAMIRNSEPSLAYENDASKFTVAQYTDTIEKIKSYIIARSTNITKKLNPDMLNDSANIAEEIETFFNEWEIRASMYDNEHFSYGEKYMVKQPDVEHGRLLKAFGTDDHNVFDAMTSMRNVDTSVAGNIIVWED